MRCALVTGASSGIGLEICKSLILSGFKVYGIGRDFSKSEFENNNFNKIVCDMRDISRLCTIVEEINREEDIYVMVNNAGVAYFGPHEELNPSKIHDMVTVNFEAPLVLTQLLLRKLKNNSGYIINISSVEAKKSSTYGCVYGATKAGISDFANSLFDETRKYGVKVVTIHPDMTKTKLYRHANFREGDSEDTYINPEEVAKAVEFVLSQREGMVVTDITLKPQRHKLGKSL
ncbi:SDR family oxidoreductase [Clostridium sp. 19966]|uniref:SDR family NAD(P)-dependent oxidoreductase n=1 Tax=Clostridium sp. 19966 TaxID=2768166 RepID=UPI0028DE2031|nr:SDR family oxidoreductase [Clostridium sp. 19966]MDT8716779.1 SDR family oxidoreductase [Clostridium sp. 19966]